MQYYTYISVYYMYTFSLITKRVRAFSTQPSRVIFGPLYNKSPFKSIHWQMKKINVWRKNFFPQILTNCLSFNLVKDSVSVKSLNCVQLFVTPWTVAHQAPLSMEFFRQEYWSGLPFPSPGDLPNPGIEPGSPALQTDALPPEPPGNS